jgi:hypothetical protein
MSWAWDVVLPLALKKLVHSFLDANWVCQAAADLISIFIMISTTSTPTSPNAATSAKSIIAVCVPIDLRILKKYIKMIGDILKNRQTIVFLYSLYPFLVIPR